MTRRAPLGHVAAVAAAAVLLVGCGTGSTPAESAPELAEGLERVDAAIVAGKDPTARDAVRALVADTEEALAAGEIEQAQADAILAAADTLLDELGAVEPPKPQDQEPVTPEPDETTESPEAPSEEPEEDEKPEKPEKPEKEEKPGKGNDHAHDEDDGDDD